MGNTERTLPVPYLTQPTPYTCQSTVLKMMAMYLEQNVVFQSTSGGYRRIVDIYEDINTGTKRPVQHENAHANMKWWLEQHFPSLKFEYIRTTREDKAIEAIVGCIDRGYPVLVSVSHARVKGHIILVTGYAPTIRRASRIRTSSSWSTTPMGNSIRSCSRTSTGKGDGIVGKAD
jgi:Peptidase_C39 like family